MTSFLKIWALLHGGSLIIGETIRRWGVWGFPANWLDDYILGALVISAALLVRPNKLDWRWAYFAGAWGFSCGMLYPSFWGKVERWGYTDPGNIRTDWLTVLVGLAFAAAMLGFVLTLIQANRLGKPGA